MIIIIIIIMIIIILVEGEEGAQAAQPTPPAVGATHPGEVMCCHCFIFIATRVERFSSSEQKTISTQLGGRRI